MYYNKLEKYSAKIKDIYIELKDYTFYHSPYYKERLSNRFIGRKKAIDRIVSILNNTNIKSGSYLIAGFRGMGKTSVIREALKIENENYQEEIKENRKRNRKENREEIKKKKQEVNLKLICYIALFILLIFFFYFTKNNSGSKIPILTSLASIISF